ncbi:hypothetical protein GCM10009645_18380 [Mycolicibacterium poriferae]|uniref:Uncharacterized protein n=1 Tax=Mycolicibacterium poriferae TaxID=39694 RepID=A0A6N4VAC3_9MYCO|nr:hypothetical protein MPOR_16930 [Mycolicibacterium poriferae]
MPTRDTTIMAGKSRKVGLRGAPEVRYTALIPATATIITSGSSLAIGLGGGVRGTSGGGSTTS